MSASCCPGQPTRRYTGITSCLRNLPRVRLGILGGTFNPPHLGHLICAQEAYLQLGLDRVTLIPARIPPHKAVEDEPGAQHRLELCRLAIRGDEERLAVSDLEIARDG